MMWILLLLACPAPEPLPELDPVEVQVELDPAVMEKQDQVEDLKYDLAGLEWYLHDKEIAPGEDLPELDIYQTEPRSYLPGHDHEAHANQEAVETGVKPTPRALPRR